MSCCGDTGCPAQMLEGRRDAVMSCAQMSIEKAKRQQPESLASRLLAWLLAALGGAGLRASPYLPYGTPESPAKYPA